MNEIYRVRSYPGNPGLFVYTCYDINSNRPNQFIISENRNDIDKILEHLEKVENQIGFDNLSFDYFLLHAIIESREYIKTMTPRNILNRIRGIVEIINVGEYKLSGEKYMSQFDLSMFSGCITKNISLTDIKIAVDEINCRSQFENWNTPIASSQDEALALMENIASVRAILKLYQILSGHIKDNVYTDVNLISARYKLSEEIGFNGLNNTPTTFARNYFLSIYKQLNGEKDYVKLIRDSKDNSTSISLKDCIPSYAEFTSPTFKRVVDIMKLHSNDSKELFSCIAGYHGISLKFGMGGVHGSNYSGKYVPHDDESIVYIDFVSMYATIATALNIYPRHMGTQFVDTMNYILNERVSHMAKNDSVSKGIVVTLKQVMNYIYGKTKEDGGPFYDLKYSTEIIVKAQLFMAKFMEDLVSRIPDITFLMVNTDSVTVLVRKDDREKILQSLFAMRNILPNLRFKAKSFDVLYLDNVNDYIAYSGDDITAVGKFDYLQDVLKDPSNRIIAKVLRDILIYGEKLSDSINKYTISDFFVKAKSSGALYQCGLYDGMLVKEEVQNPCRFVYSMDYKTSTYIESRSNGKVTKVTDNRPITLIDFNDKSNTEIVNIHYYKSLINDILCKVSCSPYKNLF